MRAMDCQDPGTHDDIHFTATDDEDLFGKVKQHTTEMHPGISDEQIRDMISSSAYDEQPA